MDAQRDARHKSAQWAGELQFCGWAHRADEDQQVGLAVSERRPAGDVGQVRCGCLPRRCGEAYLRSLIVSALPLYAMVSSRFPRGLPPPPSVGFVEHGWMLTRGSRARPNRPGMDWPEDALR